MWVCAVHEYVVWLMTAPQGHDGSIKCVSFVGEEGLHVVSGARYVHFILLPLYYNDDDYDAVDIVGIVVL